MSIRNLGEQAVHGGGGSPPGAVEDNKLPGRRETCPLSHCRGAPDTPAIICWRPWPQAIGC